MNVTVRYAVPAAAPCALTDTARPAVVQRLPFPGVPVVAGVDDADGAVVAVGRAKRVLVDTGVVATVVAETAVGRDPWLQPARESSATIAATTEVLVTRVDIPSLGAVKPRPTMPGGLAGRPR